MKQPNGVQIAMTMNGKKTRCRSRYDATMTSSATAETSPATPPPAGPEYAKYVEQLVTEQDARKTSIEQRGLAVITTSGTLVTILFALVALLTKAADYHLPVKARGPVGVALIGFVVAGVLGLVTNVPLKYSNIDLSDPDKLFWDHWDSGQSDAQQRIIGTRLNILGQAQANNGRKGWALLTAMSFEVAAVIALSIAVSEILRHY